jgi:putative oxidoreductase
MASSSRWPTVVVWILQVLVAIAFLGAGGGKLAGAAAMVDMYNTIGWGQWFRYATGAIEVGSALLVLVPSLAMYGATLLICTMIGAIIAHLTVLHTSPAGPVVLLGLCAAIAWLRSSRTARSSGLPTKNLGRDAQ